MLEQDDDQDYKVREFLCVAGFKKVASWHDAGGIERVSGGVVST